MIRVELSTCRLPCPIMKTSPSAPGEGRRTSHVTLLPRFKSWHCPHTQATSLAEIFDFTDEEVYSASNTRHLTHNADPRIENEKAVRELPRPTPADLVARPQHPPRPSTRLTRPFQPWPRFGRPRPRRQASQASRWPRYGRWPAPPPHQLGQIPPGLLRQGRHALLPQAAEPVLEARGKPRQGKPATQGLWDGAGLGR